MLIDNKHIINDSNVTHANESRKIGNKNNKGTKRTNNLKKDCDNEQKIFR